MTSPTESLNVLVVDDDNVIREIVRMHLASANFTVNVAVDGEDAFAQVLANQPDLIITDISMPRMDGFDLLKAVRARQTTALIPIILLSQHSDVSIFRRGMELGADDFLAKPVKRRELINSVTARLARVARIKRALTVAPPAEAPKYTPATPAPTSLPADELDGYRLIKKLGEGGMSQVFLAERADTLEQHVLKLARITDGDDGEVMQRFIDEYALVSQIDHPNVAKIFHQGFSETYAYIAMEYFPNGDLRKFTRQSATGLHSLTPDTVVAILIQIASALDAVHKKGIVHRDLKPDNVMLRIDGSVALADFGIAKHAQTKLYETAHGEVFGTPVYIAPEQATGQEIDHRADLYSLGAMAFELLTGQSPYQAADAQTMLEQHVHAPLPPLPPALIRFAPLLDRLLAKNPASRPASAIEVVGELAQLLSTASEDSAAQSSSADNDRGEQQKIERHGLIERIKQAAEITLLHAKPRL